jgi:hypothetical protein
MLLVNVAEALCKPPGYFLQELGLPSGGLDSSVMQIETRGDQIGAVLLLQRAVKGRYALDFEAAADYATRGRRINDWHPPRQK